MLTEAFRTKLCDFWPPCSYVLKMTEDRDLVTMEDLYDVQGDLPNGDIADDFECPLLRPQTPTRGCAPEARSGIYVPQTPIRGSAPEPCWRTSPPDPSEIGPPAPKKPVLVTSTSVP